MSLIARLGIGLLIGFGVFLTYLFFAQKEIESENLAERVQGFYQKSLSNPTETIIELKNALQAGELLEEEWLLLFELLTESAIHSHLHYIHFLEDKRSPNRSVEWQITDACISYRDGNVSGALNLLQQLVRDNPAHRRANYEYHRIQFLIGSIDDRIASKLALRELSQEEDRWAYKSLRLLAFSPPRPGVLKKDLIHALEALRVHKWVVSADFLRASEILYRINDAKKPALIFEEMHELGKDRLNPIDFGHWLLSFGQPQNALKIIPETEALISEDSFMIRFQALLENNQTSDAQSLLNKSTHLSFEKKLRANAYLDLAQGKENTIEEFLTSANELQSAVSFLDVARIALLKGNGDVAYKSFQKAWGLAPEKFSLSSANQFLQISLSSRNTKEAHQITNEIWGRNPEKFGNANNRCYLSLLLGENVEALEKEALRICNAFPGNPSFLSTLALAKLLGDKPDEALEIMRRRGPVPLIHGERALLACILSASGKTEDAQKVANGLVEVRMLPEEWTLLQKYDLGSVQ
jgi:hypothetical protein